MKPTAERLADAAERSADAQANIAAAWWEMHNYPTPLVDALADIGAGLHRIADAIEGKKSDDD